MKLPLQRAVSISLLFVAEAAPFIARFHARVGASFVAIFAFGFLLFFLAGGYLQYRTILRRFLADLAGTPIRWRFLAGHLGAVLSLGACSIALMHSQTGFWQTSMILFGWYLSLAAAIVFGLLAMLRADQWYQLIRETHPLAVYSSIASVGIVGMQFWVPRARIENAIWKTVAQTTFKPGIAYSAALSARRGRQRRQHDARRGTLPGSYCVVLYGH